jgi:hypothetical protein
VPPPRDELVIKVLVALQVPGIDVHEILHAHRRQVIEVMQRYTRIKAAAREDDLALALVADAELLPARGDRPLARCRRRPPEAAAARRAAGEHLTVEAAEPHEARRCIA